MVWRQIEHMLCIDSSLCFAVKLILEGAAGRQNMFSSAKWFGVRGEQLVK